MVDFSPFPSSSAFLLVPPATVPSAELACTFAGESWFSPETTDTGDATTGRGGRPATRRSPGVEVR